MSSIQVEAVIQLAKGSAAMLRRVKAKIVKIDKQLRQLERRGLVMATPQWRQERRSTPYLYLDHGKEDGKRRRREYVGNDQARVKSALEAVERGTEHARLQRERQALTSVVSRAESVFLAIHQLLSQVVDNPVHE